MKSYLKYILMAAFVASHLISLTLLPIFTDETNYLDWGWREIHLPGFAFYSLYDAKQPLMMWFFGIAESLFSDPLFAGRVVSVFTGLATALGVYYLGKKLFNERIGHLAFVIYGLSHYFFFFDRQALVESGQAAIFTWIAVVIFSKGQLTFKKCLVLGILFGLSYLTKSNSLLVIGSSLLVLGFQHWEEMKNNFGISIAKFLLLFTVTVTINLPMLLNPWFIKYIHLSTQYTFTISEILHLPFAIWTKNFSTTLNIFFWFITPITLLAIIMGIFKSKKYLPVVWVVIPLVLQIFMARFLVSRYLVSYLPILIVYAAYWILSLKKQLKYLLLAGILLPNIYAIFLLVTAPQNYFYQLDHLTKDSYIGGYVTAEASGYNTVEARKYFDHLSSAQPILLGIALFSGNPEASLLVYYRNSPNIKVTYLDAMLFGDQLKDIDCLIFDRPVYLASRDKSGGGLLKYFDPLTTITNKFSDAKLYVFKLKENCQGKTFDLTLN